MPDIGRTDPRGDTSVRGAVLFVDDDAAMCELVSDGLGAMNFEVTTVGSAEAALDVLDGNAFDVVLTDLELGGLDGLELCARLSSSRPDIPVLVLTGFGSMESAVGAIRAGAYDFFTKPVELDALAHHVHRAVEHRRLRDEVRQLRERLTRTARFDGVIGESAAMRDVRDLAGRVARTDVSVLITGETGTGKEVVANAIHEASERRGPLVAINCAAVPESLLESELFGHVRGAFTNARTDRKGLFREANGGTVFLDEIGEMPTQMQVKLLRALQEQRVRPVGGDRELPFDARIIAATNRDLADEIRAGNFRDDLYYRLRVVSIELPPLRQRGQDVILLAEHFLRRYSERYSVPIKGLSEAAVRALVSYDWPGNVRELENAIDRAVALGRFDQIGVEDLPPTIVRPSAPTPDAPVPLIPVDDVVRRHVLSVLEAVDGNKSLAAEILQIDRKTLYRRLKSWRNADS